MRIGIRSLIKLSLTFGFLVITACTPPPAGISNNQSNRNSNAQANSNSQPNLNAPAANSNAAQVQKPAPGTANIVITSTPSSAAILFVPLNEDGASPPQQRGFTPNTVNVPAGKYYFTLELSGYVAYKQTITVRDGDIKKVNARLKKR